jgi:hypothetical protein
MLRGIDTESTLTFGLRAKRVRLAGSRLNTKSASPLSAIRARVSPRPTAR